jgi:pimeloyl-ACP methyl ester carboxylesterase
MTLVPPLIGAASILAATFVVFPASTSAAELKLEECRLQHPDRLASYEGRCGELEVAENPDTPAGAKIRLRVAVVPSVDQRGAKDPLFVLAGGPGQAATDFYAITAPAFARVQRDRDLVLVDQRGTGGSNPLECDFPDEQEQAELRGAEIQRYTRECLAAIKGDPRYYTTSIAVRDLDAVRAALGYERINLYGVSYGTRVAQHYLRRYPQHTRSAILDGVVPPEQILGIDSALVAERALRRIFARCHAEPACHAAFADPAGQFRRLRNELAKRPAEIALADPATGTVERAPFRIAHLQVAVRLLSYAPERAALLPLLLDQAVTRHNLAPLAAQARMISDRLSDAIAVGMHNSVVCTEDAPFFDSSAIDRGALAQTYLGTVQLDGLIEMCKVWPRGKIDKDFHAPLLSNAPVLLLSGSADPVTPPEYAERASASLRKARHVYLEGQGHGQLTVGCVPRLMAEFLAAGSVDQLDTTCTKSAAPAPFFISFSGPAP